MSESKHLGQSTKILIGLVVGIVFGLACNLAMPKDMFALLNKNLLSPVGAIFLNSLKVTIVPLVLLALICGTASMGDPKKLGRVGGRTMIFYLMTTIVATIIGIILALLIEPGSGVTLPLEGNFKPRAGTPIVQMIVNMFPDNIVQTMSKTDMLQLLVFAVMVGYCFTVVGKKAEGFLNILVQANEVMMKFIDVVIFFAPYAVFCLIARVVGQLGLAAMIPLGKYLLCILVGCLIQVFIVYAALLKVYARKSIFHFINRFFPVMSFAFSTQSSTSTIPINMETCEQNLGISRKITSFTIPFGATVNMDGTAVLQGVAALFIAQYSGIELSITQMLTVLVTATLASIGAAGMPGTALIMLTAVCQSVGLPIDAIVLLLSVDRMADMIRTTVNVTGDAVVSLIVAKMEGEFNEEIFDAKNA